MTAPGVRGPADLPGLRMWLREQWRPGRPFGDAAGAAIAQRAGGAPDSHIRWEVNALTGATLWWVSEDMVDLLMAAAPSVPDDVMFANLTPPSHAGMVVFAKPITGMDADTGAPCQLDLMLWGGTSMVAHRGRPDGDRAVSTSWYRRLDFTDGLTARDLRIALATGATLHADVSYFEGEDEMRSDLTMNDVEKLPDDAKVSGISGYDEDGLIVAHRKLDGVTWAPLGRSDWPISVPLGDFGLDHLPGTDQEVQIASAIEDRRLLAALWTLVQEEGMAATTTHVVPRQERRRAERAGITASSNVQVVTLRKLHRTRPDGATEHDPHRYDHRWTVSGHWRNQPCGPGRAERRLTWIRPHVKGPDEAPLVIKERVNAWVR